MKKYLLLLALFFPLTAFAQSAFYPDTTGPHYIDTISDGCAQWASSILTSSGSACPTSAGAAFPFTPTTFGSTAANSTSTLIGFTNGLYSLASSTIGNGTQAGGLTISGGATTTGSAYIAGALGIGNTAFPNLNDLLVKRTSWTDTTNPQVLIFGADNEATTTAFKIQDENGNNMLDVMTSPGSATSLGGLVRVYGRLYGGISTLADFNTYNNKGTFVVADTGTIPGFYLRGDNDNAAGSKILVIADENTGTETFHIQSTGTNNAKMYIANDIGIATTTPNNLLDLYSTSKPALGFSGASGPTYKWTMGMDVTDGGKFKISSSTALGTSDRFVINGSGNVGVGTTTPGALLSVHGDGLISNTLHVANLIATGTASTTNFFGAGLNTCQAGNVLTYNGTGKFGCAADATAAGAANPFTWEDNYAAVNAATTSILWAKNGLNASSTSHFVFASTTMLSVRDNMIKQHSAGFLDIQRTGADFTLARIRAPRGDSQEATLSLVNDMSATDAGVDEEFVDFYNENYSDSRQWGFRQAYSGTGAAKPFVLGHWNTAGAKDAGNKLIIHPSGAIGMMQATSSVSLTSMLHIASSTAATLLRVDAAPGTNRFIITSGGSVGIGTTSPTGKLEIGDSTNGDILAYLTNSNSGASATAEFNIRNGYLTGDGLRLISAGTGGTGVGAFTADSAAVLGGNRLSGGIAFGSVHTTAPVTFYSGGSAAANERMRISSGGDVAIGTTSPQALFHLSDSAGSAYAATTMNNGAKMYIDNRNTTDNNLARLTFNTADTDGTFINAAAITAIFTSHAAGAVTTDLAFQTKNTTNGERMRLTAAGNLGIGSTTPGANLVINGTTGQPLFRIATSTNQGVMVVSADGYVGIGTSSPSSLLSVQGAAAATSTVSVISSSGNKGGRIILMDTNGTTCTEVTSNAGVLSAKAITCP